MIHCRIYNARPSRGNCTLKSFFIEFNFWTNMSRPTKWHVHGILFRRCLCTLLLKVKNFWSKNLKSCHVSLFTSSKLTISLILFTNYRHCWSQQYAGRVLCELRNRPRSPYSLCVSVVEHRSAESEGLRVDSSGGLRIFLCPTLVTRRKTSFFSCHVYSGSKDIF